MILKFRHKKTEIAPYKRLEKNKNNNESFLLYTQDFVQKYGGQNE